MNVIIIGGGIGGLTLGLELHRVGISCRIFEAAAEIRPIGAGMNILPHACRALSNLGLKEKIAARAVETKEAVFFNRFGQLTHTEPLGRAAGLDWPQFSIHRGVLQEILLQAFIARAGADRFFAGWQCNRVSQDAQGVEVHFQGRPAQRAAIAVACDGVHSIVRKEFHPLEREPRYSGVNMWRGLTRWKPFLSGASLVRAGALATGKMVIYPIENDIDAKGRQLINWVAEIPTPRHHRRDWNRPGRVEDFIGAFEDWHLDWLDVPALIRAAHSILEFPMIDQDPLDRWSEGRITLLGDAAHPMVPRGSNGGGQAILDAHALARLLHRGGDPVAILQAYEAERRPATTKVVLTNRESPPGRILDEVYRRTGDKPFQRIEDVISRAELQAITDNYKRITGYDKATLEAIRD